jgi:hypothetical protein
MGKFYGVRTGKFYGVRTVVHGARGCRCEMRRETVKMGTLATHSMRYARLLQACIRPPLDAA